MYRERFSAVSCNDNKQILKRLILRAVKVQTKMKIKEVSKCIIKLIQFWLIRPRR